MPLTQATREHAREIIARYPKSRSALLPMLHLVQSEEGYVSADGVALCAQELGLTKAEVGAVATFYTMYKRRPCGDFLVSVCTNLSCQILGGEEIYAGVSQHLGVGHDQSTADGQITLEHAECLAACDYAPVVTVNYEFYDNQTPESTLALVEALQRGDRPAPTRGEPLATFREIERQLAGIGPAELPGTPGVLPEPTVQRAGGGDPVRLREAAGSDLGHPDAPAPTDSRGQVPLAGTDMVPAAEDYGTPGGVTERVVSGQQAARTYGQEGTPADAGTAPVDVTPSPRRDATRMGGVPADEGTDESPAEDRAGNAGAVAAPADETGPRPPAGGSRPVAGRKNPNKGGGS